MHALPKTPALLQLDDLNFSYPQRPLFSKLSLTLPAGVSWLQGCGKTTLLRVLAGDLPASMGRLTVKGLTLAPAALAYWQLVFWADPRSEAFDQITPNAYFASLQRIYPSFDTQALAELTHGLSLTPHLDKPLYMLSTGSKRKVWLAAAFAAGAAVTLLDEPFAALDKASIQFVLGLLHDAAREPTRAWLLADFEPPGDVPLASCIELGD